MAADLAPRIQSLLDERVAAGAEAGVQVAVLAEVKITGHDEVMGIPSSFAFGFSNFRPGLGQERPGSTLGMIGMNGSAAYADLDSTITFALMRNHLDGDLATVIAVDRLVAEAFPS